MDIDLGDYARAHIFDEVRMLLGTYALLPQSLEPIGHEAALESFLLHALALDEFLGCSDPRNGDVVARRYVETWQPTHPLTAELRSSARKRLAHLTEDRVNRESIQVLAILAAVAAGFERFLGTLSHEQRSWFALSAELLAGLAPFVIAKATTDGDDFKACLFAD